jgi:hypothetical protein
MRKGDQTMNNKTNSSGNPGLRLPLQVAPVDRTLVGASFLAGNGGVAVSQNVDLGGILNTLLPVLLGAITAL